MPMEMLASHRVFATSDVDEASDFAGQIWEQNRTTIVTGDYGLRWNHLEGDQVGISYIEHDCTVDLKTQGPISDHYRFFVHQSGSIEHRVSGGGAESHPERVVAHTPGTDLGLVLAPCEFLLVTLDGAFVRRALEQRFHRSAITGAGVDVLPPSPSLETLRSMATWMATEADRPGSPLSVAGKPRLQAERLLLSLFVDTLGPSTGGTAVDAGRTHVRKAEEWIEAHLTEPIGVEEVATAVGVGVRSLQMSFKRVHGSSPRRFIMARRLERVRQMLLHAGPHATVTDIATSAGFFELGRFAQRYRQRFGEGPSLTLTRRRELYP